MRSYVFERRGLGHIPDAPKGPGDQPDHDAAKATRTTAAPAKVAREILGQFTQTLDQGGLGSCTCNAAAQAMRADEVMQTVAAYVVQGMSVVGALRKAQTEIEFLSRLFQYYLARSLDGTPKEDSGTQIRYVFQTLNTFGFPRESAWTYSDDASPGAKFSKMPPSDAFRQAFDQRAKSEAGGNPVVSYSRIQSTGAARVEDVKRAIADKHLVVFGTPVTNAFCSDGSANGGKPIDPPTNGKDIAGGHALAGGGYDDKGMDFINSWGVEYGDAGWGRMSWEYVTWDQTSDLWIVKRAPLFTGAA